MRPLLFILSITLVLATPAFAQCTNNMKGQPGVKGEIEMFHTDNQMRYCDGAHWIDMGQAGTGAYGNADPTILISHGNLREVVDGGVVGNYYYYVTNSRRFGVLDVTNVQEPVFVTEIVDNAVFKGANAMQIVGNYAYVLTEGSHGFVVIDISTPAAPAIVAQYSFDPGFTPHSLGVSGNYAYVTGAGGGFRFYVADISNPLAPTTIANIADGKFANRSSLTVSGNMVYLSGGGPMQVVDVSNPAAPVLRGALTGATPSQFGRMHGGVYYDFSLASGVLSAIDVTDPDAPAVLDSETLCGSTGWYNRNASRSRMPMNGNYMFLSLSSGGAVASVDVSNPNDLKFYCVSSVYGYGVNSAAIKDGHFIGLSADYADRVDISDPTNMVFSGVGGRNFMYGQPNYMDDLQPFKITYDNFAFTTFNAGGVEKVRIWDVTDPVNVTVLGGVDLPSTRETRAMAVTDHFLYTGARDYTTVAINAVDFSNPASPMVAGTVLATVTGGYTINGMAVYQDRLITRRSGRNDIQVFDISNRANPVLLHTYAVPGLNYITAMRVNDNGIGFFAGSGGGSTRVLRIVDLKPASGPVALGSVSVNAPSDARAIITKGKYAFMSFGGHSGAGIKVIDIGDLNAPVIVSSFGSNQTGIALIGHYLFANYYGSLDVYDVSNPLAPVSAFYDEDTRYDYSTGSEMFVSNNYLLITNNGAGGTVVVDPGTNYGAGFEAALCTGPDGALGAMHYDYLKHRLRVCNGNGWQPLGPAAPGGLGCSSPSSREGVMDYDNALNRYKYCNGGNWVTIE